MSRRVLQALALTLTLSGIASTAAAHHPPRFERCQSVTFTGRVERIEWVNPHVELFIRTDDGVSHEVAWLNMQRLHLADIGEDTLRIGDRVVVTAGTRMDVAERPMLLSNVRRISDGWEWSQTPQGC